MFWQCTLSLKSHFCQDAVKQLSIICREMRGVWEERGEGGGGEWERKGNLKERGRGGGKGAGEEWNGRGGGGSSLGRVTLLLCKT